MNERREQLQKIPFYITAFLKWLLLSIAIGLLCGAAGAALHCAIDCVTQWYESTEWLLYTLPALGLVIVFIYKIAGLESSHGTNDIFQSVKTGKRPSSLLAPVIFLATGLTHLGGGSAGRESAALQIGGSVAGSIGALLKLGEEDVKIITLCGMSAVFSAAFGTPIAAAVFCIEVVSVGVLRCSAFMPCMISSFAAFLFAGFVGVPPLRFDVPTFAFDTSGALTAMAMGLLCAVISVALCYVLQNSSKLFSRFIKNPYMRIVVGGLLIIGLTLLAGNNNYNGSGLTMIAQSISGETPPVWDFAIKLLFTAVTLGAGFRGGEIIPTLATGAAFGAAVSAIFGLPPALGAMMGMTSVFCGAVNCPLASIIMGIELFGAGNAPFIAIACAVSFMVSGRISLYTAQEFAFSKLLPK